MHQPYYLLRYPEFHFDIQDGVMMSSKETMEFLWEEFFRDPSQFWDIRKTKKTPNTPDFRHKRTGKALWLDGRNNPPWLPVKLQRIGLPSQEEDNARGAVIKALKSCENERDVLKIKLLHADKSWIAKDIYIATTLIHRYAKCGALKEAREVFDQLPQRDVAAWNALIAGYADQGFGEEALKCFTEMENDGMVPNAVTYICSLKACAILASLDTVEQIHHKVREHGLLKDNLVLGSTLVNAYAKCGAMRKAQSVFNDLPDQNVVSWNALMFGYVDQGFGEEALRCFTEMKKNGVAPNAVTFICSLKACSIIGSLDIVEEMHAQIREQGLLRNDIVLGTALVYAYAKCGALREAQEVFEQLTERNVASWNALIAGYTDQGFGEEALRCFREMENDGVIRNSVTYICSLKACAIVKSLVVLEEIHTQLKERGLLKGDIILGGTLIHAYVKCGALKEAREFFKQLPKRNATSWNTLMFGYADQGLAEEVLECFMEMQNDGMVPDSVTFNSVLQASIVVGSLEIVEQIHAQVIEQGLLKSNVLLGTTLVNAYAKCGAVKEAQEVFDQLEEQDVASWNVLLAGYAQLGQVNIMLELFNKMLQGGFVPNLVTFLVLLNGCNHGALMEDGQRLFDLMGTYGLFPTPEHYTCMVDLLGRSGRLDKAKFFVLDDMLPLLAFLGACRKWVNVDLGLWAFESLLQIDQHCASVYVCMANTYAAAGMMKEANEIEYLRVKKKAWKN